MKIKKHELQGLLQYMCDINEFGFEDDNIDSIEIWTDKAEKILYELKESPADYFIGLKKIKDKNDKR